MIRFEGLPLKLVLAGVAMAASCSSAGEGITVRDAWVRSSPMMARAVAVYMVIENGGSSDDRLVSVKTDAATSAELHKTEDIEGMMGMSPLSSISVPARGRAVLQPGGMHVMLMGLLRELKTGDTVELVLNFEKAGPLQVSAIVRDQ